MDRLVIFDLDGTLIDTIEDLGTAVNHALALRNLPGHSMEEYRAMVGHGVRKLVEDSLPEGSKGLTDECLRDFLDYYVEHIDVHTRPYPGMQKLAARLDREGYALAVASNKFQAGTEKLIAEFFPGIDFVAVCGNRTGFPLKPDPALIEWICEAAKKRSGAAEVQTILVGDSDTDMKTAANAGIPAVAVTWGFRSRKELGAAGAVNFAGSSEELYKAISDFSTGSK